MEEIINAFQANPIFSTGCIIFIIGVLIFLFWKKIIFRSLAIGRYQYVRTTILGTDFIRYRTSNHCLLSNVIGLIVYE